MFLSKTPNRLFYKIRGPQIKYIGKFGNLKYFIPNIIKDLV